MTKKAFLITGFSNWGKTTLLRLIVHGNKNKYIRSSLDSSRNIKSLAGRCYSIQHHSNDDKGISKLLEEVGARISYNKDLLIAFCPTFSDSNDSRKLLSLLEDSKYEIHIVFITNKWDLPDTLNLIDIKQCYSDYPITCSEVQNSNYVNRACEIIKSTYKRG